MTLAKALIVDDESLLREHLQVSLQKAWPELEICGAAANGEQALQLFAQHAPQVVFLDIRMPGISGIEVAQAIRAQSGETNIVFLTAYDEYAVKAFEQGALDYLLKPLEPKRLDACVERLQQRVAQESSQSNIDLSQLQSLLQQSQTPEYLRWIKALKREELHLVAVEEVVCFMAQDKYTTVYTQDQEYLIKTAMKELEQQLDPNLFWRIHRSYLVNAKQIKHVKKELSGQQWVVLKSGRDPLPISRRYSSLFKQM
ncbi:LytR/AlgR family response regulator transcription factor [Paraferrimonas sedimenticola]|uniref:Response regulatory protein n=1 Tax=Paraferrimonas sedimenticola TaxID=375674 RepID=A0AA37W0D8_9GAMM|nr:LytTR family DNA-binding domain-containing protein [Paraferrimonas sedimenticola]GLP96175.1 putative response regulatory protein [Paraferrimonas sedimenticola]